MQSWLKIKNNNWRWKTPMNLIDVVAEIARVDILLNLDWTLIEIVFETVHVSASLF